MLNPITELAWKKKNVQWGVSAACSLLCVLNSISKHENNTTEISLFFTLPNNWWTSRSFRAFKAILKTLNILWQGFHTHSKTPESSQNFQSKLTVSELWLSAPWTGFMWKFSHGPGPSSICHSCVTEALHLHFYDFLLFSYQCYWPPSISFGRFNGFQTKNKFKTS